MVKSRLLELTMINPKISSLVSILTVAFVCIFALLRDSLMDTTGFIQGIGTISSVVKAPTVGLTVEKSGRTTGTTTGTIGSINTSVNVQYQIRCGQGKKYVISYTNQIVVNGSGF